MLNVDVGRQAIVFHADRRDEYSRLLAYVCRALDGLTGNLEIIGQGMDTLIADIPLSTWQDTSIMKHKCVRRVKRFGGEDLNGDSGKFGCSAINFGLFHLVTFLFDLCLFSCQDNPYSLSAHL